MTTNKQTKKHNSTRMDFSCVGGRWIKKWVSDKVSVGVVDLGHVRGGGLS